MKKLLLLIACTYTMSAHAMKTQPTEKLWMWTGAIPTYADMTVTKLCKEYNNHFSGLTINERKKRLTEAKNLKSFYKLKEQCSDTICTTVIRLTLTAAYFSDLTEREKRKMYKNPSDKLEKIIKRLTTINRSEQINRWKKQLQRNKRIRRLMFQAKQLQQNN
jgi:hypothetical protein